MSSADAADFGFKRFRVSKACVVCRLRKTRCNGQQPCDRCQAHSAECKYETIETTPRRTSRADSISSAGPSLSKSSLSKEDISPDASDRPSKRQKRAMIDQIADRRWGDRTQARTSSSLRKSGYVVRHLELYASIDQDEPAEDDTELHTEDGVRAHDQHTGNLQFYGLTSGFNFQHRLTQTIEALRLREHHQPTHSHASIGRGRHSQLPESLKMWGHHNIIFRQTQSEASFPTLDGANNSIGDSTFLPPSIVDRFVENYMTLIQPQLGAVPKRQILKWVKDAKAMGHLSRGFSGAGAFSAAGNVKTGLRTNELAALYVVLALGAMMDEGDWEDVYAPVPMAREGAIACATTLFLLAKKRLEEIVENSSIQSARCLVLMSFFSLQWSQPNVAYLYIGYAARMCISIGLHRETFYASSHAKISEHRQLWWTCYSMERMISTWFGQASAIRDDDLSTRLPRPENSHDAYLYVNAQIARVCSDMSRLSANPPTHAHEVLLATELMDAEMLQIRADTPKDLAVGLQDQSSTDADDDSDSSDLVVRRYSVTTFWWYLRLLIYSPLVIFALYGRSAGTHIPANVLEKTNLSARAGQRIIDAICNARSDVPRPGLDNMRFGSFYLDSACTIVLSAILCDPSNQELAFGYLASIDRAIKYLEKKDRIYADHGTKASLYKAKDLVALARQVVRAAAGQTASSRVQNGAARKVDGRVSAKEDNVTSTFQTSSERETALEASDDNGVYPSPDALGRTTSGISDSRVRDKSSDLTVAGMLSPPSLLPRGSRTAPQPDNTALPTDHKAYASERDDWMQYFLSNFDWLTPLSQPGSANTPGVNTANSPFFVDNSPGGNRMVGGGGQFGFGTPGSDQTGTVAARRPKSIPTGLDRRSASSDYSSPGSAAGPASLSELDMGLIMGGVSVMESDQQQQ